MQPQLSDFLTGLAHATTATDAGYSLLRYFQDMGADGGNIWFALDGHSIRAVNASATTYAQPLLDYQYDTKVCLHLQMPHLVARSTTPIVNSLDRPRFPDSETDTTHMRMMHELSDIRSVAIFPAPMPGRTGSSGVSICSSERLGRFQGFFNDHLTELQMAAMATHYRMQAMGEPVANRPHLSPREIETLEWFASGLRTAEVAWRMNISERMVNEHVKQARKKLDAKTREQAIARAIMVGLIRP